MKNQTLLLEHTNLFSYAENTKGTPFTHCLSLNQFSDIDRVRLYAKVVDN